MLEHIDHYCECTGPELWAEPINAATNLAFILAGLWGLQQARTHGADAIVIVLCWWVVAIGVGSALFHTFANRLTMLADIIPIAVFTLAYTAFAIRRFLGLSRAATAGTFVTFYLVAGGLTALVPGWLHALSNGSMGYLPAFLALVVFGGWVAARGHEAGPWLLASAAIFLVSVTFRAFDQDLCAIIPLGTHFMWHLLNALMLALLLAAAARHGARSASAEA